MNSKLKKILYISIIIIVSLLLLILDAYTIIDKSGEYNLSLNTRIYILILLDIIIGSSLAFLIIAVKKYKYVYSKI